MNEYAEALAIIHDLHPVVADLLARRCPQGASAAASFLHGSPLHDAAALPGVMEAASFLAALPAQARVWIWGDYDVDGVSGAALLLRALQLAGISCRARVPHRHREGYGLNWGGILSVLQQGCDVLITVDCGISCPDEVDQLRQHGVAVILTDHHPANATRLPQPDFLIHPLVRPGYPFPHLCGSAVAWKLAQAVLREKGIAEPADLIAYATLGTVADVVPLCGENRDIVRAGLRALQVSTAPGLNSLLSVCAITHPAASDIGFQIAPRINALGRLGDADNALRLLTTNCHFDADQLANLAQRTNGERRAVERAMIAHMLERFAPGDRFFAAHDPNWHAGVVGVAAGRVAEKLGVCAFVGAGPDARGVITGSARSGSSGVNVRDLLACAGSALKRWGGHEAAAGFSLECDRWADFVAMLAGGVATFSVTARPPAPSWPELRFSAITDKLFDDLKRLEPFGAGNPEPVFRSRGVLVLQAPRLMGASSDHLSVRVNQGGIPLRAVGFGMGDRANALIPGNQYDMDYMLSRNTFRGVSSLELRLKDFRPS